MRIKVAEAADGTLVNVQPEYDDCAAAAETTGWPLKHVQQRVMDVFYANR